VKDVVRHGGRLIGLLAVCLLALQLFFALRIVLMAVLAPESTSFQRSEAWRLLVEKQRISWSQQWLPYREISPNLKRAVIASEDAGFAEHSGVEWDALEKAWQKNQKAEVRAEKLNQPAPGRTAPADKGGKAGGKAGSKPAKVEPKLVGGSTITQQLAKNLFLSGERTVPRKAQEFVIAMLLEGLLPKQRILEIYLNNVEWGEGIFGAQAASRHYFHIDAERLSPDAAARLAVMLPAPKRFEKNPGSAYVAGRSATIVARMGAVRLP